MKSKILFVSHDASLTGAPLILLYFMEWLKKNYSGDFEIGIFHLNDGELKERFDLFADFSYQVEPIKTKSLSERIVQKIFRRKYSSKVRLSPLEKSIELIANENYDIIYANTVSSLPVALKIKKVSLANTKLIAHIHELRVIIEQKKIEPHHLPEIDRVIAVSNIVKDNLINQWGISESMVDVVYEFSKNIVVNDETNTIRSNRKFVIGASGFVHWRKGHDLFIQVARYLYTNYKAENIEFCWVGNLKGNEKRIVEADLDKLNLRDKVKFVGQQPNPQKYFNEFDVFVMTSREDPFPLVCIEVGMLGKPIICFDKATGTQEMLTEGGGKIVPYLNIEKMAVAIWEYYENPDSLAKDSQIAKKVFEGFSPQEKCPEIYEIIKKI